MLPRYWHRHFAKKQSPIHRERRFAWFAKPANEDDENQESVEQNDNRMERSSDDSTERIAGETELLITKLLPEIASKAAWSPFILEQTLDILRDEDMMKRHPHINATDIQISIGLQKQALENGNKDTELAKNAAEDIETLMRDRVLAVKITEAFEKRMEHMHEQIQMLGNTQVTEVIAMENEYELQGKSLTAFTNEDAWTDAEVDDIIQKLSIDPSLIQGQDKGFKLRLIHKKAMAARKISAMERNDLDSEFSASSLQKMEKKLFAQMLLARKHTMDLLKKRADALNESCEKYQKSLISEFGDSSEFAARGLGISERALKRRLLEIQDPINRARGDTRTANSLREARDKVFTQKSTQLSRELDELAWLDEDYETFKTELRGDGNAREASDNVERTEAIQWLVTYAPILQRNVELLRTDARVWESIAGKGMTLDVLENTATFASRVQSDSTNLTTEEENFLYNEMVPRRRREIEFIIAAIESPALRAMMEKDEKEIENNTRENTVEERNTLHRELDTIEQAFFGRGLDQEPTHDALQHETVKALRADKAIREKIHQLRNTIRAASTYAESDNTLLRETAIEIHKLETVKKELDQLNTIRIVEVNDPEDYKKYCGVDSTTGCYEQSSGYIFLNTTRIGSNEQERQETLYHEQGHAILDTLVRRTGLLPHLLVGPRVFFEQKTTRRADGSTLKDMLFEAAEGWHMEHLYEEILVEEKNILAKEGGPESLATTRADAEYFDLLIDELINKYASYKNGKRSSAFTEIDKALFAALDEDEYPISVSDTLDRKRKIALQNTNADDDADDADDTGGAAPAQESGDMPTTTESISFARNSLLIIRDFIDSHDYVGNIEVIEERYRNEKDFLENMIEKPFYEKTLTEADLAPRLRELDKDIEIVITEINRIKSLELDMGNQNIGADKRGFRDFVRSIEFISIMDIVNTVKQGAEDVQRMWKRRGERVQSRLGQSLTDWIGDSIPYAGQLKHEYAKRGNASEIEEVNQWKEAIKDEDSYALLSMVGKTRNRDQVRAILEVLSERGRMDWNYEPFWDTLNAISVYSMPKASCKNNDLLRDKWLQKLTTDIWGDKDKYFEWRQSNDGNVDSGKKKFTATADQLSNIGGGLAANLKKQLMLWTNSEKGLGDVPDDVNPHLYEEVLHYSMRNGKMSMEEKLYYLVQGVATGLLSIDRLRAMAGEDGGILNQFPFIDYFYGKNNSLPEVQALANRLTESDDPFKPGAKTTLWLHLELTRNESARQRMAKATSGARTEQLDHEDIPTIISQMDYKGIDEITGVLSGSRFKMSNEAAKNTYTGFGTKFKILAQLAKLHQEGKAQFTQQDAQEAAKSIAAYAHLDNILTRNGTDGKARIEVTLDQIATQTAPSAAGHKIKKYRDGNTKLVRSVIDNINMDWDGTIGVSKDQYIRSPDEEQRQEIITSDTRQGENFNATEKFSRELSKALADPGNRDILINILASMTGNDDAEDADEKAGDFKEENHYNKITSKLMGQYLNDRRQHGNVAQAAA